MSICFINVRDAGDSAVLNWYEKNAPDFICRGIFSQITNNKNYLIFYLTCGYNNFAETAENTR